MADSDVKLKRKKRKQRQAGEDEQEQNKLSKTTRTTSSSSKQNIESEKYVNLEVDSPWGNLQLILLLQDRDIDIQRKLEVAFSYVQSREGKRERGENNCQVLETVSVSRVILFISDWIQSILISSAKKIGELESSGSYLDCRCWVILKFCLEEALKLKVSLSILRDILRVFDCVASHSLTQLQTATVNGDQMDLVLACTSLIFTHHGGVLNENLDLWIAVVEKVLKLVQHVLKENLVDDRAGLFVFRFSSSLLEPFIGFLRVHPARKNGFHDFIDRLLEPLMNLLDELHLCECKYPELTGSLLKLVGEVLSQGLFHPTHIEGFLNLQSTLKYKASNDVKTKPIVNKSYHRHLFEKMEKTVANKFGLPLGGVGELLHLFVVCVKKQKGISSVREGSNGHNIEGIYGSNNMAAQKNDSSGTLDSETRNQLLDFFVHVMEYFLSHINAYAEAEFNDGTPLSHVLSVFISVNKLLASFENESIYVRADDTSDGASSKFLRFIYESVMSFSAKIKHLLLLSSNPDGRWQKDLLFLIAKEIVVTLHHLVDVGYEVVGDDLESLWVVILGFTASCHSKNDCPDKHCLELEILHIGCRLIDLYSELRQVDKPIFALSKAVRHLASDLVENESHSLHFRSPYSNSLGTMIGSAEFRLSIRNAIRSIPEGQASGCIQLLNADISDSLEWMKTQCQLSHSFSLSKGGCAELLGRILAEVYTLILDSMTVTSGNSTAVGHSVEKLVALMSCSSEGGDLHGPDFMENFFCIVSGRIESQEVAIGNDSLLCWLLVFCFRLYLSSRNLYRESISLVPPESSIKMSETMGDIHTAYAGKDWLERTFQNDTGYFSWIIKSSASLDSIIHNVSNIFLQESFDICPPLVYILNAMSIQRLVDLNSMSKSLEYLLERNNKLVDAMLVDDTELSLLRKRSKKLRNCLLNMKLEAAGLTKFLMSWLSLLIEDSELTSISDGISKNLSSIHKENTWDLSVGSLNKRSLSSAIWWIICQHVDVWCDHGEKRDLKKFLTYLIRGDLLLESAQMNRLRMHCKDNLSCVENVTIHQVSLQLLNNAVLYEQRFFCRHIVSRLCRTLETSFVSPDVGEGYLISKPDWSDVIDSLDTVSNGETNTSKVGQLAPLSDINIALCSSLLNFIAWMPKGALSSKCFLKLVTCILNVERVVVGSLLNSQKTLREDGFSDLLRLFLSCRRILESLFTSYDGKMSEDCSTLTCLLENSSLVLWLLKSSSAVMGIQTASSEDITSQLFMLMDHTSNLLTRIGKHQFEHALQVPRIVSVENHSRATVSPSTEFKESEATGTNYPWKNLELLNEILSEHKKIGSLSELLKLKKLSSVISSIQGFLWGFTSVNTNADATNVKPSKRNMDSVFKLNIFMEAYAKSLVYLLQLLFLKRDINQWSEHTRTLGGGETEVSDECIVGKRSHTKRAHVESLLTNVELFEQQRIKKTLLQDILGSKNPELAVFVKQCLLSASVILRVSLELNDNFQLDNLVPVLFGISEVLLVEFTNTVVMPPQSYFVCLDGVVKFLEELGKCFSSSRPMLARELHAKLIDLHLRSIGKCIVLQKKRASLASKGSNIKDPIELSNVSESSLSAEAHCLDSFKARLRMSFRVLMLKSSDLHLLSTFQAIERAIVGVQGGCLANYEIYAGGKASLTVAAGIDCLDVVIETGRKIVRGHIQGFVACLLNIMLHLQGPSIFFESVNCTGDYSSPDPGSIILMCVDILRRVPGISKGKHALRKGKQDLSKKEQALPKGKQALSKGKHASSEAEYSVVGQFLNIPATLFQIFLQNQHTEALQKSSPISADVLDRRYSLDLYALCCQLLFSVVKHCASEIRRCSALLQHSVNILLQCLETVKTSSAASGGTFTWEVQDGVKCACALRRVYEEIRQQKKFTGSHCHEFLSSYISVYCGFGPRKTGITREVDRALRPGVYALMDVCSDDDLERLHTLFGEGPCRSTLKSLRNDYKLYFQYGGKI